MSSGNASKNRVIKCIILVIRDTGRHAIGVLEGRPMHRCAVNRFPNVNRFPGPFPPNGKSRSAVSQIQHLCLRCASAWASEFLRQLLNLPRNPDSLTPCARSTGGGVGIRAISVRPGQLHLHQGASKPFFPSGSLSRCRVPGRPPVGGDDDGHHFWYCAKRRCDRLAF